MLASCLPSAAHEAVIRKYLETKVIPDDHTLLTLAVNYFGVDYGDRQKQLCTQEEWEKLVAMTRDPK